MIKSIFLDLLFISTNIEGDIGGPWTPQHCKKKNNEHRITARKVDETPSPQQLFLATWFQRLHLT